MVVAGDRGAHTVDRSAAGVGSVSRPTKQGWWGIAFVVLNLFCQAAVSLPETTHTTAFIAAYYAAHRWAITLAQVGELVATVFIWFFFRALSRTHPEQRTAQWLLRLGWAIVGASVLTTTPVLVLALVPGMSDPLSRLVAVMTDMSDVVLFAVVTLVGLLCATSAFPVWVRISGLLLAVLSFGRVALYFLHQMVLDQFDAIAFLGFVLAFSVRLLCRPRTPTGA